MRNNLAFLRTPCGLLLASLALALLCACKPEIVLQPNCCHFATCTASDACHVTTPALPRLP